MLVEIVTIVEDLASLRYQHQDPDWRESTLPPGCEQLSEM